MVFVREEILKINSFKDLEVWQVSMELVVDAYEIAGVLPSSEKYGLSSQIQRAAVSIPSNIAEGSKRTSRADFRQFCLIALGSAAELETQFLIIRRLYVNIDIDNAMELNIRVQKMLSSLCKSLKQPPRTINDKP